MSSFENLVASAQEEGQGVKLIGLASEVKLLCMYIVHTSHSTLREAALHMTY